MKIKKFLVAASVATLALSASAANPEDVRIYINPGHGAYCGECRPMSTIKHGNNTPSSVSSDTSSFFESNTNLQKGFGLLDKLVEYGVKYDKSKGSLDMSNNVVMSRVKSGDVHEGLYDRNLSEIAAEVQTNNFDMFISIHSNATTGDHNVPTHLNHCLYLYRGHDGSPSVAESDKMAAACWPHSMTNKHMNYNWLSDPTRPRDNNYSSDANYKRYFPKQNYYPSGKDADGNPYWIKGDLDFMYYDGTEHYSTTTINGVTYKGYYNVLRHGVPGFLVEGYDHTYQPAIHRAMNHDVTRHEGELYAKGINDYFGWGKTDSYGKIYGIVRDPNVIMNHAYYQVTSYYKTGGAGSTYDANQTISQIDNKKPLNNVLCRLLKDGVEIDQYITDDEWNGAFFFKKVAPGSYTIELSCADYTTMTMDVEVTADKTTYINPMMTSVYTQYPDNDPNGEFPLSSTLEFNQDYVDVAVHSALSGKTVKRVVSHKNFTYVLAHDTDLNPYIYAFNNSDGMAFVEAVNLDGIVGYNATTGVYDRSSYGTGELAISDIAVTGDGYLIACSMTVNLLSGYSDTGYTNNTTRIYKWKMDQAGYPIGAAEEWITTTGTANWYKAVVGRTMAYSGTTDDGIIMLSSKTAWYSETAATLDKSAFRFLKINVSGNAYSSEETIGTASTSNIWQESSSGLGATGLLSVSPLSTDRFVYDGSNAQPIEINSTGNYTTEISQNATLKSGLVDNTAIASSYFKHNNKTYMVAPTISSGNVTGVTVLDITNGFANASKVTTTNTTISSSTLSTAFATGAIEVNKVGADITDANVALHLVRGANISRFTTAEDKEIQRSEYAYDLNKSDDNSATVTLNFKMTGDVPKAKIILKEESTGEEYTQDLGALSKGQNSVTISKANIKSTGTYTWAVEVHSDAITYAGRIYKTSKATNSACGGVAFVRDFNSTAFGKIVASSGKAQGLDVYSADLTVEQSSLGSSNFLSTHARSPYRIAHSDGYIYVVDGATSGSNTIWRFNPTDNSFNASMTGTIASCIDFLGEGADRKLYSFVEGSYYSLVSYNVGASNGTWSSTPSTSYSAASKNSGSKYFAYQYYRAEVLPTTHGTFVTQLRYAGRNNAASPGFVFVDESNNVLMNSGSDFADLNAMGGGVAINDEGNIFAVAAGEIGIKIYRLSWNGNTPSFVYQYAIPNSAEKEMCQLDFDHAGNLYAYGTTNGFQVYSLQNSDPNATTWASDAQSSIEVTSSPVTDLKVARQCYGEGSNTSAGSVDALVTWSGSAGSYTVYYQTMRRDASTPTTRVYDNNGTWVEAGTATIASGATLGSFTHKALAYGTDANGNYDRIYNYKVVSSTGEEAIIEGTGKTITSFAPTVPVNVTLTQPTESIDLDGDNTPETLYSFNLQLDLALNDNFSASRLDDGDAQATATQYVISVDEATATALNNASNASEIGAFVAGPTTISAANCSHHSVDGWYMIVDFTDVKPADAASAAKSIVWKNVNPGLTYQPQVYVVSSRAFNFNASDKESASLTMTVPAPEWTPANDEVVLEALTGDYSSLASTEDKPMGTFRLVGSTTETNPVVIANANTVGTNGAALSPLPVTDDVIGTSANSYADAGWNVAYTITLKEGDAEVAKSTHDAQTVDASLYSNSEKRSCDVMGLKVGTKSETTPDGRTRLVYNADYTPTYTMVVEATYTRGDVSVTGTSEHELTINPTFATPEIKTGDDSRGLLFLETSTHWDEAVSKYYKYYYDAVVNLTWDIAADNLNYYIGYHATPKFECLGHYEKNSEGVTSSEWVKYYPASVLTNSAIESYNSRTTPYLTELGYTGAENWSLLAAQSNHLPMKIHYVYGSDSEIGSDLSVAGADVELSADYPIIVGPSLMVNQYPETGTYALSTLSRAVVYDMQVISAVKSFSGMTMDDIINTPATGVENVGYGNGSVRLFPNPVSSHFTLQAPVTITDVKIFASDGQLVKEVDADDTQVKIDVSDLASGVYVVHAAGTSTIMIKK